MLQGEKFRGSRGVVICFLYAGRPPLFCRFPLNKLACRGDTLCLLPCAVSWAELHSAVLLMV